VIPKGTSRALDAWVRWSDPAFAHCTTFVWVSAVDAFVELQCWHSGFRVEIASREYLSHVLPACGFSHVLLVSKRADMRRWRPRLGMTCVSVAKAALGIRASFAFTPKQLFAYLNGKPGVTRLV
jgi:hypothetical protein